MTIDPVIKQKLIEIVGLGLNGVIIYITAQNRRLAKKNRTTIKQINATLNGEDKTLFVCSICRAAETPSGVLRIEPTKSNPQISE